MYSLILAGGSGSRLWPLSRELYPKQLLDLNMGKSLLQSTYARLECFTPSENIISITNDKHQSLVKNQLQSETKKPIVLTEPVAKNTAPAIAAAAKYIQTISKEKDDSIVLVVPSDHLIKDFGAFKTSVMRGKKLAQDGYIVTFGIKPTYPETGYGYINIDTNNKIYDGFKVNKFVEKPNFETAEKYVSSDNFYWNGGIFMFKTSVLLEELNKYAPDIFNLVQEFDFTKHSNISSEIFEKMPSISIDYALMEKSDKIALIKLESDWNDLGSWKSIYDINEKDKNGNVVIGNVINEGAKNSLLYSTSKLIAAVGLEDTIIVETEDAILACNKNEAQKVKNIYDKLKQEQNDTYKIHQTVYRPWGYYTVISAGDGFLTKKIHVYPGQKLSIQSHNHRAEHWVVAYGKATVLHNDNMLELNVGECIDIGVKEKHSLQNLSQDYVEIIELQHGDLLSEDDIIRYEDMYGRV